jgi:hypothetical protein
MKPQDCKPPTPYTPFIFNQLLDVDTLNNLYSGDYPQAEAVFENFLMEARDYPATMLKYYQSGQREALQHFAHKIAHTFNYVGLFDLAEGLHDFEHKCSRAGQIRELQRELQIILQSIHSCLPLVQEELKRLRAYNLN